MRRFQNGFASDSCLLSFWFLAMSFLVSAQIAWRMFAFRANASKKATNYFWAE